MRIVVGTSGWQYKEWRGSFYPEKMKEAEMLAYYASRLSAVEVNYTFRRVPPPTTFANWTGQVGPEFRFVLKAPQSITHYRRLKNARPELDRLMASATTLGRQLGPILLQLPSNLKADVPRLQDFLADLPPGVRPALEFRHPSWYTDPVFATLKAHNAALCLAETDTEAAPRVAIADWGYLRLRRAEYTQAELDQWLEFVCAQPWGEANVFFKHENEARGPRFATRFSEMIQARQ